MIQWLRENPVLWNKKMRDYKDSSLKDSLWAEQAKRLNKDVKVIQVWYKSIRTRYRRLTKKLPSGSGATEQTERDKWVLTQLDFLRPYIAEVTKRVAVSIKTKAGSLEHTQVNTQGSTQSNTRGDTQTEPEDVAHESDSPFDVPVPLATHTPTPSSSRSKSVESSTSASQNQLISLHQELINRLKRPQPIAERDSFADWIRTALHGLDGPLFRKCQVEVTQVLHRYQEMQEQSNQRQQCTSAAPSVAPQPSSASSRFSSDAPCAGRAWQPHPSQWPDRVNNPVSVWNSQDSGWVQQQAQQPQQSQPQQSQGHQASHQDVVSSTPQATGDNSMPSLPSWNISGLSSVSSRTLDRVLLDLDSQQPVVQQDKPPATSGPQQ